MISQQHITELGHFTEGNKVLEELYREIVVIYQSPYYDTYLAILEQVEDFNRQLKKNKMDLFADKEDKAFERGFKYMKEACDILSNLERLKEKMTHEEQKAISSKKSKVSGVAL
ncbi:MAG: hypothetical protein LC100_00055 [Chitinophagales bacterium]|nr:hypothetical protein [Chitinophagales bacterium]